MMADLNLTASHSSLLYELEQKEQLSNQLTTLLARYRKFDRDRSELYAALSRAEEDMRLDRYNVSDTMPDGRRFGAYVEAIRDKIERTDRLIGEIRSLLPNVGQELQDVTEAVEHLETQLLIEMSVKLALFEEKLDVRI
jgi:hypothetical protein